MSDEVAFLAAIRANPDDEVARLVYADWLDEHDEPARAAFLRAECEVRRLSDDDPGRDSQIAQLRRLAKPLDGAWKAAVARMTLEKCGVRWEFVCPKRWEQLAETDEHWVRFCSACKREVYYCTSITEARWRAECGDCVAVDLKVRRSPYDLPDLRDSTMTMGLMPMSYSPPDDPDEE